MRRDLFRRCYCGTPPSRTRRRSSADSRVRAPTPRDQIPNESRPRVRPYREPEHRSKGKDLQTSLSLQGQGSGRFAHKGSQDNARVQDEKLAIGTWAGQKTFSTESAHALLAFRPHPRQLHFAIEERQLRLQMRANAAEYQRLQPTWIVVIGQRSEEHTSELQSRPHLVCRLLLEKKKKKTAKYKKQKKKDIQKFRTTK